MNQQVDIYDLAKIRDVSVQNSIEPGKSKFLKTMRNVGVMTDFNRRMLVSRDWFFSNMYRDMLKEFFAKKGEDLPEAIASRF